MIRLTRLAVVLALVTLIAGPLSPAVATVSAASDVSSATPIPDHAPGAAASPPALATPSGTASPVARDRATPTTSSSATATKPAGVAPTAPAASVTAPRSATPTAPAPASPAPANRAAGTSTGAVAPSPAATTTPLPASTPAPTATMPPAEPTASPSPPPPVAQPGPAIPPPPPEPAIAPAQLLPTFARASALTGVPQEVLLAIARIESGFDPRAVGPYLPQFAGTENEYALGMMQFLPGTYRGYSAAADAATGKQLGLGGIWDAESSIYAAAYYLRDSGAPADLRRALFAYNNANWYVDLILAWAGYYAGGVTPDPNVYNFDGAGRPIVISAPQNPQMPVRNGMHLNVTSPVPLYAPFTSGQTWTAGGAGSFYGREFHSDNGGAYYAVDFNKGSANNPEPDEGQPVLAAADGIVNNVYASLGGGWTVELYHRSPDGTMLRSLYLHLNGDPRVTAGLQVNQPVVHGTPIGYVGNTGVASTGAHLHFALYALRDGQWLSIRPEPMEGQQLRDGGSLVSHNDPGGRKAFEAVWQTSDRRAGTWQQRSWLWGPQAFTSGLPEQYLAGPDGSRLAQYYDKGRFDALPDGKGGYLVRSAALPVELLTGRIDLGNGRSIDYGPAPIPLTGDARGKRAPTYADAGVEATQPTLDYTGLPVIWQLLPGGRVVPFTPPVTVRLAAYDSAAKHNIADVFARWLAATGLGPSAGTATGAAAPTTPDVFDPGRPLTDPFWVTTTIAGAERQVLVQIFERWVLTYTPSNPPGWRVELGNVGRQYYEWRYEEDTRLALLNEPPRLARRRRWARGRRGRSRTP